MFTERNIVIVEDDSILRSVLTEIFREYGWRVRAVDNGFASLQAINDELPAVLLSDLEMDGMSGFELLSIVRRRFPTIRVVAMSGAFAGNDIPSGVAADAFYAKGGSVGTLLDLVTDLGNKQVYGMRRSGIPVWLPLCVSKVSPNGVLGVACSNCMRAIYLSLPYIRPETQLVCPHCQQEVTVFSLHEPVRLASGGLQTHSSIPEQSSSHVGLVTSELGGSSC